MRKEFADLVYDKSFYLTGDFPPPVVFLPNAELLEVMIRIVGKHQDATIYDLMDEFGIVQVCFLCNEYITKG